MICIMLRKFFCSTRIRTIRVGITVGLVFIVVGAEAHEILLDQEPQECVVVKLLGAGNAYVFATNPSLGERARNFHSDHAAGETSGKVGAVGDLKPVYKIATRAPKLDLLVDRARPAEGLNLRLAEPKANRITENSEFHGLLECESD